MILQSEIIPNLTKKDKKVCIIVPNAQEESLINQAKPLGVAVFPIKIENSWGINEFSLLKKYIYEDIRNNPALWEKHMRSIKAKRVSILGEF